MDGRDTAKLQKTKKTYHDAKKAHLHEKAAICINLKPYVATMDKPPIFHIAFYRFTPIAAPVTLAASLRLLAGELFGSILVATEGINGVLAGSAAALTRFEQALTDPAFAAGAFAGLAFKRSNCITPPFARLKVHVKPEIVALGASEISSPAASATQRRRSVASPQQWRELLADENVVVLDNRNSFEYRLGHFSSAIDPQVENFRDFSAYLAANAPAWQAAGKRVAMYCTGGIRCEKTSARMQDFGLDVVELEGGILNYFQQIHDAELDWQGECFVFDNRIALDASLHETATTAEDVYVAPEDAWRLARARRLDAAD